MAADNARPCTYPKRGRRPLALRSFRKSAAAEEQPPPSSVAATAARARRAMAWPWLRRAEAVAAAPAARSDAQSDRQPPPSSEAAASALPAAASDGGAGALPRTGPPTPLYDEVELSGLTSQMADFLQRQQGKQADQQTSATAAPAARKSAAPRRPRPPLSAEEAAAIRSSISSCAGLGVRGPISVLQRLLRKVLPGSYHSSRARNSAERPVLEPDSGDFRHHYHHYIHHHHYHYHYDPANPSSEEGGFPLRSRRHSESSDIRSRIPALIYEDDAAGDEEDLQSNGPLSAFLARRRRNSDSIFAERFSTTKASRNCEGKRATARVRGPADNEERRWFSRRYNSERYLSQTHDGEVEEELWRSADLKSRRRNSTESWRAMKAMEEEAAMAAKAAGGLQKVSVLKEDAGNGHELKAGVARRRSASFVESRRRAEVLNENSRRDGSLLRPPSPAARSRKEEAYCTYSLSTAETTTCS